jgi:hypothetical protein
VANAALASPLVDHLWTLTQSECKECAARAHRALFMFRVRHAFDAMCVTLGCAAVETGEAAEAAGDACDCVCHRSCSECSCLTDSSQCFCGDATPWVEPCRCVCHTCGRCTAKEDESGAVVMCSVAAQRREQHCGTCGKQIRAAAPDDEPRHDRLAPSGAAGRANSPAAGGFGTPATPPPEPAAPTEPVENSATVSAAVQTNAAAVMAGTPEGVPTDAAVAKADTPADEPTDAAVVMADMPAGEPTDAAVAKADSPAGESASGETSGPASGVAPDPPRHAHH